MTKRDRTKGRKLSERDQALVDAVGTAFIFCFEKLATAMLEREAAGVPREAQVALAKKTPCLVSSPPKKKKTKQKLRYDDQIAKGFPFNRREDFE